MAASDILTALKDLEFDEFIAPVEAALGAFREQEKARTIEAAAKKAATKRSAAVAALGDAAKCDDHRAADQRVVQLLANVAQLVKERDDLRVALAHAEEALQRERATAKKRPRKRR